MTMRLRLMIGRTGVALAATWFCLSASASSPGSTPTGKPKLIVAISIDQFSAGLFDQYRDHFSGGLRRMIDAGVVFPNGYQSHAATETCPGHSTILTGRHPTGTGIIANDWLDPKGTPTYCVSDTNVTVPGRPKKPVGPANLNATTLGDWMKARDPASRVVAVSGKDRAAINMGGHDPDAVFWWDDELGFNTYVPMGAVATQRLEPVKALNDSIAQQWQKALPGWPLVNKSCARLNADGTYDNNTLRIHHQVPPSLAVTNKTPNFREDPQFKVWVRASPIVDQLTLELAKSLLKRYKLGQGPATDLLALSLSATDYVGHKYGNQGPEMCDQLTHLDQGLAALFKTLDSLKVPYVVMLTADHGAIDAAERADQRGFPADRLTTDVAKDVNAYLRGTSQNASSRPDFQLNFDAFAYLSYGLYFKRPDMAPQLREQVIDTTVAYLNQQPWVARAVSKANILKVVIRPHIPPDELTLEERFAESISADRSPDILIAFKPYATVGHVEPPANYIANHGSPWNYDRRVPILFWRPGLTGYEQYLPIETVDIAPTLAALIDLPAPEVDGRCIDLDGGPANTCPLGRNRH